MFRIIGVGIVGAVLGAIVSGGKSWGIWVGFIIFAGGAVIPLLTGQSSLRCPHCGKRVKLGKPVCHHCGREAGRAAG